MTDKSLGINLGLDVEYDVDSSSETTEEDDDDEEEDEEVTTKKKRKKEKPLGFVDYVFSWSTADIMNKDLYRNKVNRIPDTFSSSNNYLKSFVYPLLEETRAELHSNMMSLHSAPSREIVHVRKSKNFELPKNFCYSILLKCRREYPGKYEPVSGDLIALTDVRPKCIDDLNRSKRSYLVTLVQVMDNEDCSALVEEMKDEDCNMVSILSSKPIVFEKGERLFAVYILNLTTNRYIWNALHRGKRGNVNIINSVLRVDPSVEEKCSRCSTTYKERVNRSKAREVIKPLGLNRSQENAVLNCIALRQCYHENRVKLIWGPPGTGKTKTVASLVFTLLRMKCKTLTCAPTNVAVIGVAKRLMSFLRGTYGFGDIVLFGNVKRMEIDEHEDLNDIFLENRISVLAQCLAPLTGWEGCLDQMKRLLEDPQGYHKRCLENSKQEEGRIPFIFVEFFTTKFFALANQLIFCIKGLCTHLPTMFLPILVLMNMIRVIDLFQLLGNLLHDNFDTTKERFLKRALVANEETIDHLTSLCSKRLECLQVFQFFRENFSVQKLISEDGGIKNFCLRNACLVFCTVSSSAKLDRTFEMVIIDEAAQLKECESSIPLQLRGLRHAVLVGDEKQLPAMVTSKICEKAGFGRSLFERLVMLGHNKHLLNIQYRMHPSISSFPNKEFYGKQVIDGPNVRERAYGKRFLHEKMFGSFSFINITNGKEEIDNWHSRRNPVEVYVVAAIVSMLYEESMKSKEKVRVGCISPYKAQVYAIQELLRKGNYSTDANSLFSVNVRSVDGFQGGEEDVIIISTVRCNRNGSLCFLDNRQRANVALTRARYCLWVLGDGATLLRSSSVWQKLVMDAKRRGRFYNAYEDKNLSLAMSTALIQLQELNSLFRTDSVLFKVAIWKVCFSPQFHQSIKRFQEMKIHEEVVSVLVKLSNGWRHEKKKDESAPNLNMIMEGSVSSQLLELYDVKGTLLKLAWTIEIMRENSLETQVIKVLDILPQSEISNLAKKFDAAVGRNYSRNQMSRCMWKQTQEDLIVPMTWPVDHTKSTYYDGSNDQLGSITWRDNHAPTAHTTRNYRGKRRNNRRWRHLN